MRDGKRKKDGRKATLPQFHSHILYATFNGNIVFLAALNMLFV